MTCQIKRKLNSKSPKSSGNRMYSKCEIGCCGHETFEYKQTQCMHIGYMYVQMLCARTRTGNPRAGNDQLLIDIPRAQSGQPLVSIPHDTYQLITQDTDTHPCMMYIVMCIDVHTHPTPHRASRAPLRCCTL